MIWSGPGPGLLLAQAQLANASGRTRAAGSLLDAAERASDASAGEPFETTASPGASLLANVAAGIAIDRVYLVALRGDAEAPAAFATQAVAELGEGDQMPNLIA